jgi:trehalose-6-phosphatase
MLGLPASLPIYVGDEPSDESAFAALPTGITILVGHRRHTAARYILTGTNDVRIFLERLEELVGDLNQPAANGI